MRIQRLTPAAIEITSENSFLDSSSAAIPSTRAQIIFKVGIRTVIHPKNDGGNVQSSPITAASQSVIVSSTLPISVGSLEGGANTGPAREQRFIYRERQVWPRFLVSASSEVIAKVQFKFETSRFLFRHRSSASRTARAGNAASRVQTSNSNSRAGSRWGETPAFCRPFAFTGVG